jgi:hypothetical protein
MGKLWQEHQRMPLPFCFKVEVKQSRSLNILYPQETETIEATLAVWEDYD